MALIGLITILVFLLAVISKKMSVTTALVVIPLMAGLVTGTPLKQLGAIMLDGIKQVAPTGIMLIFAVLYFAIMLEAGLFDPIIKKIVGIVGGDPLKVLIGTAILTMIVHLDGDGTATFMIVISAFLPIYEKLNIKKTYLAGIIALAVGPMHLVPWSGTSARAISTLKTEADVLFRPNLLPIAAGIVWVIIVAWIWGRKERKRLGIQANTLIEADHLADHKGLKRPKLIAVNGILTITLIALLIKGFWPAPVLFLVATVIAILINYPSLPAQNQVFKLHGAAIFSVSSMIFAAGIFSGILTGTKMIEDMSHAFVGMIPQGHANLIPVTTALLSMPMSLLFTPDAYYFGIVPVLAKSVAAMGMDPLQIGRAALLGQMTVGFPISPLTASTFLLINMTGVELGEHQKKVFPWAWATTIIMTILALLSGSISL